MLLEALVFHKPDVQIKSFEYRAVNPVIVNRQCNIHGSWESPNSVILWAQDDDGVVGMTGMVTCA
jgi:hydroxyacyl-ACP dehydratase HTD2-like protein with hotdog domain